MIFDNPLHNPSAGRAIGRQYPSPALPTLSLSPNLALIFEWNETEHSLLKTFLNFFTFFDPALFFEGIDEWIITIAPSQVFKIYQHQIRAQKTN